MIRFSNKNIKRVGVFFAASLIFLVITEIEMRYFLNDYLALREDERNLTYRYDRELGWFPIADSIKTLSGIRTVTARHNGRGFRDPKHLVGDTPGIVFIGDSFLWGFDVEEDERFADKLRAKLSDWSIYNLGISGYGTDQEFLLLKNNFEFYHPKIVFLVYSSDNDEIDNSTNERYGGYYKPYFTADENALKLGGTPVPKSENYFFVNHDVLSRSYWFRLLAKSYFRVTRPDPVKLESPTHAILSNMNKFVSENDARFVVGIQGYSPQLEEFLSNEKISYVSLANPYKYHRLGHWTPAGNTYVSEKIYGFLLDENLVERRSIEAPRQ
ncbi:MAG: SGNH/GDSL hydrolase family protein [Candidatus Lindowbacteria bacterium]|nr:SGNH/GDSL hydrolase family protein [Candidatus Lindowbacteria bacterium]